MESSLEIARISKILNRGVWKWNGKCAISPQTATNETENKKSSVIRQQHEKSQNFMQSFDNIRSIESTHSLFGKLRIEPLWTVWAAFNAASVQLRKRNFRFLLQVWNLSFPLLHQRLVQEPYGNACSQRLPVRIVSSYNPFILQF